MLSKVHATLLRFEASILASLGKNFPHGLTPALAFDVADHQPQENSSNQTSLLDSILGNGILWASVPKHRRTAERRATRRMAMAGHRERYLPKKDIVACLECGHWHQTHTICGHCYEKVKEETKAMQEAMGYDKLHYDVPHSEVHVLYEGEEEEKQKHQGKHFIEMKRKRPEWFPKELMTPAKK
ncbi:large ribosomal subunit protein bL32m-like [Lineus longissimus]|uniref:large ribosomal subunit protein bL32m-like n=1 Tax=Lineus longissimus TaxID=88925 RepID=UPI00315CF954